MAERMFTLTVHRHKLKDGRYMMKVDTKNRGLNYAEILGVLEIAKFKNSMKKEKMEGQAK